MKSLQSHIDESLFAPDSADTDKVADRVSKALAVEKFFDVCFALGNYVYTADKFNEKYGYRLNGTSLELFTKKLPAYKDNIKFFNWKNDFGFTIDIPDNAWATAGLEFNGFTEDDFTGVFTKMDTPNFFKIPSLCIFSAEHLKSLKGLGRFIANDIYIEDSNIENLTISSRPKYTEDYPCVTKMINVLKCDIKNVVDVVADSRISFHHCAIANISQITTNNTSNSGVSFDFCDFGPSAFSHADIQSQTSISFYECNLKDFSGANFFAKEGLKLSRMLDLKALGACKIKCLTLSIVCCNKITSFKDIKSIDCSNVTLYESDGFTSFEGLPDKLSILRVDHCKIDYNKFNLKGFPKVTGTLSWISNKSQKIPNELLKFLRDKSKGAATDIT